MDWAGVLTTNMVEVIDSFETREGLKRGLFLSRWATREGQELYRQLELGLISQEAWNEGFGEPLGIPAGNLMGRLLGDLEPAYDVLRVVRFARTAGVRTAVLSNSLGREPHDPYARYRLPAFFDVIVLSAEVGLRKPDEAIFQLTVERLGVPAASCMFADDTEANLVPAMEMGMTVIHALDEHGGVQIMHGEIGIGRAGQVDRVTARELVVSAVVCADCRVEPADSLDMVAEFKRG
jgi:putative hydrolase of the HAD superfamily